MSLFGNDGVAYVERDNRLYSFDCLVGQESLKSFELTEEVLGNTADYKVKSVTNFRRKEDQADT